MDFPGRCPNPPLSETSLCGPPPSLAVPSGLRGALPRALGSAVAADSGVAEGLAMRGGLSLGEAGLPWDSRTQEKAACRVAV